MAIRKPKKGIKKFTFLFCFLLLTLLFSASVVYSQENQPSDDAVNQIASQLFCPVCENISLDVCALEACRQWRDLIRQQLADGWSEAEIKEYFVAQYGDRVLGEPPRQGLNWLLYLVPPAAILLGIGFTAFKLRSRPVEPAQPFREDLDPYLEKVEQDLRNLD
jgi:cytochrome c-type biogenesis protein CcmH